MPLTTNSRCLRPVPLTTSNRGLNASAGGTAKTSGCINIIQENIRAAQSRPSDTFQGAFSPGSLQEKNNQKTWENHPPSMTPNFLRVIKRLRKSNSNQASFHGFWTPSDGSCAVTVAAHGTRKIDLNKRERTAFLEVIYTIRNPPQ